MADELTPPGYEEDEKPVPEAKEPVQETLPGYEPEDDDDKPEPEAAKAKKEGPWTRERAEMRAQIEELRAEKAKLLEHAQKLAERHEPAEPKAEKAKPAPRERLDGDKLIERLMQDGEGALEDLLSEKVVKPSDLEAFEARIMKAISSVNESRDRERSYAMMVSKFGFLRDTESPGYKEFMTRYSALSKEKQQDTEHLELLAEAIGAKAKTKLKSRSSGTSPIGSSFDGEEEDQDAGYDPVAEEFKRTLKASGMSTEGLDEIWRKARHKKAGVR